MEMEETYYGDVLICHSVVFSSLLVTHFGIFGYQPAQSRCYTAIEG